MHTRHMVDDRGRHHVTIDGLRVWIYQDGPHWIAHGIDIDYATSGDTLEEARHLFALGLCRTIVEHLRRFNTLERLLSRRAPDEIYQRWLHELERDRLTFIAEDFSVPEEELPPWRRPATLPHSFRFYQPAA
jgi:hypothetical protein